jgi:hypothetical protein
MRLVKVRYSAMPGLSCGWAAGDAMPWEVHHAQTLRLAPRTVEAGQHARRGRSGRSSVWRACIIIMQSSRAIEAGTAVLIVGPELCLRTRWDAVNKLSARSAVLSVYAPLVSWDYLRTRRE